MAYRLVTKFVAPEDTHTVLVITRYYWGKGTTKAEAMAACKAAGGAPGRDGYVAYYFGAGMADPYVDGMGYVCWDYTDEDHRPEPVKELVGV